MSSQVRGTQLRTHRAEVHEAGDGNNPGVHEVDDIATIELEEPALDTRARKCGIRRRAYQKAIGHPIVQEEHEIGNDRDCLGVHECLVSKRAGR